MEVCLRRLEFYPPDTGYVRCVARKVYAGSLSNHKKRIKTFPAGEPGRVETISPSLWPQGQRSRWFAESDSDAFPQIPGPTPHPPPQS